jgi:hypothetical protein
VEPGVVEDLLGEGALLGVAVEHGRHEGLEELGLLFLEAVPAWDGEYLAIMTSLRDQFCSLGMRLRQPSLLMYFRPFSPRIDIFRGKRPISSMICARWSSFLPKCSLGSFLGLKSNSPVKSSKVMQASDHISAERLYLDPSST